MEEAEGSKRQKLSVTRGDGSQILVRETRDLLSGLHDDLLHHIMSFMSMEEIIRTGFLSRRWRYLWRNIPFLDFALRPSNEEDRHTGERRVSFVETLLFRHKGSRVKKLCINVDTYYINKYQVDSWIDYALDGDVEELDLDFSAEDFPGSYLPGDELLYDLPPAIYRCETLQSLKLCCCDLNLPTSIHLRSLKTLCLTAVDLPTNAISALTSNCPVLEELSLKHCNIYLNLNISIPTKHLNILRIIDQVDEFFDDTEMVIDVPNLLSLEWKGCLLRDKYHIKRLSSLLKARFDLEDALPDKLELFLHSLHHVQDLTIDCVFIQVCKLVLCFVEYFNSNWKKC
uniref:F-box domain-containing protein n=1 Tax=Nelumbo nucifera TaxID=4432 RepID=A0A822ZRP7_NELNU|nr:TPA_asm: hypothetical protein HUJ06_017494 [Nelumbo nucifera]